MIDNKKAIRTFVFFLVNGIQAIVNEESSTTEEDSIVEKFKQASEDDLLELGDYIVKKKNIVCCKKQ